MARAKKQEVDPDLYEGLTETEVKDAIIRNLIRKQQATVDLKAFRDACNSIIVEVDERNEHALEYLAKLRGELPVEAHVPNLDALED
jgi:hypothetical protein